MRVLDCETVDSTYRSLEQVLGIGRSAIKAAFADLDLDRFHEENPHYPAPSEEIVLSRVLEISEGINPADRVCWFHLTRTFPSNTFAEGILPLGMYIEPIWEMLFSLTGGQVSAEEWQRFRKHKSAGGDDLVKHSAHLYALKVSASSHWGPFGMLVREIAFQPEEALNHDYLEIPEIIEDICSCFSAASQFDLRKTFLDKTRPCIVKFYDDQFREGLVTAALFYIYNRFHGNTLGLSSNTCFDGEGVAIPRERILSMTFL